MIGFILRRLAQAVVITLMVSVLVFILLHSLPGGLVRAQLGGRPSSYAVAQLTRQEGLLRPLPVQYGLWLWNALHGNLGFSYKLNQSVGSLLDEFLPRTLLLAGSSLFLAVAISIPIAIWQAQRRGRFDDHALNLVMMTFYSMPSFLLGAILIVVLSLWVPLLPSTASNYGTSFSVDFLDLMLPMLTLCLATVSYFSRYMRASIIDNMLEDYVRTAYAKGASRTRVLLRHVLRNSLGTTATLVALCVPFTISGVLIVEAVFNFPGVGLLFWNAAQDRDYPVLLGVVLVVTVATIVSSLAADIAYAVLDPRVRYSK
jgi:peptide/nickel transport system permease protein